MLFSVYTITDIYRYTKAWLLLKITFSLTLRPKFCYCSLMPYKYATFLSSPDQFGTSRDLGSSPHLELKVWARV